ncbi:unnamed protein product, partial [Cyprideis torosa]
MGNYKDDKMQLLADAGNGNHAYIDDIKEAKKMLVSEFGGTLFTIAKDVKVQVEFNPAYVDKYRLIGYENRKMEAKDFRNDMKDAGEMGAGHSVTVLYEITPTTEKYVAVDDNLRYQNRDKNLKANDELATVRVRYKTPSGHKAWEFDKKLTSCPWNSENKILHIGLQGKKINTENLPASNLVFLIDVSGSMSNHNKLPLVKESFKLLVDNLREDDNVAIVTYAGAAGIALESTPANQKEKIIEAIDALGAGGSTAGAQGIKT